MFVKNLTGSSQTGSWGVGGTDLGFPVRLQDGRFGFFFGDTFESLAAVHALLRSVAYSSTSEDPTVNATRTSRTISWQVTDANSDGLGAQTSAVVSTTAGSATGTIEIGGIKQVVSIRSQDLRNPVLIYFHGGPGFVEMPLDWWWNRGWDEYFTVVHWDQRNAGKTFTASEVPPGAFPLQLKVSVGNTESVMVIQEKPNK